MRSRLLAAAAAAALPTVLALATVPAIADAGGNNGTIKVAEVDDVGTDSNDPHVGCTFALEWYNFDAKATSSVTFAGQGQDADVAITVASGSTTVTMEDDAAKGNTELDHREIYTLAFSRPALDSKGYHVKVTPQTDGSQGNDTKSKVFWVGPCDGSDDETGNDGEPTEHGPSSPEPFTWDWRYADPTCSALTVAYPADIPSGQANDVNIRVETDHGQVSLNFHNNEGTWAGTTTFPITSHRNWPAGVTSYDITWVQVGGTNYHWQGDIACATDGDPLTPDVPQAVAEIEDFTTGTVSVRRGSTVPADTVEVDGVAAGEVLTLERYVAGTWQVARSIPTSSRGTARVTFPRFTQRGSYTYRLTLSQTLETTGDATGTLTVRVR